MHGSHEPSNPIRFMCDACGSKAHLRRLLDASDQLAQAVCSMRCTGCAFTVLEARVTRTDIKDQTTQSRSTRQPGELELAIGGKQIAQHHCNGAASSACSNGCTAEV